MEGNEEGRTAFRAASAISRRIRSEAWWRLLGSEAEVRWKDGETKDKPVLGGHFHFSAALIGEVAGGGKAVSHVLSRCLGHQD